jgi:hypothetical protein
MLVVCLVTKSGFLVDDNAFVLVDGVAVGGVGMFVRVGKKSGNWGGKVIIGAVGIKLFVEVTAILVLVSMFGGVGIVGIKFVAETHAEVSTSNTFPRTHGSNKSHPLWHL